MMILRSPEKSLNFKLIMFAIILFLIAGSALFISEWTKLTKREFAIEKQEIIEKYEIKVQDLERTKNILSARELIYINRIDSLKKVKNKVIIKYDEKVKNIYNSDAYEHAHWLDSIIRLNPKVDSLGTQ